MKIAIATKKRWDEQKTLKIFCRSFGKEDLFLFLEPEEKQKYERYEKIANVISIEDSNRGIGYARKFILNYFKPKEVIWMLDDDIDGFYLKCLEKFGVVKNLKWLGVELEKEMKGRNLAVMGTRIQMMFLSEGENKGMITQSYLIDKEKMERINYDEKMFYNEDKLFLIDLLRAGKKIGLSDVFYHRMLKTGEREEGCQEFTEQKKQESLQKLYEKYPQFCEWFLNRKGEKHLKFKWKKIEK